jgi:hypothetical protein
MEVWLIHFQLSIIHSPMLLFFQLKKNWKASFPIHFARWADSFSLSPEKSMARKSQAGVPLL